MELSILRDVSWKPRTLALKEFPLPECNPLQNESYVSGSGRGAAGDWCQQSMTQESEEPAGSLEYGVWGAALGCFAKELVLVFSGRISLKFQRKSCLDLWSLR